MVFWVYILHCADGSYYTGHTDNLENRLAEHTCGAISSCYTFKRRPVVLVFSQDFPTREEALASEQQIKGWRRKKKEAMIRGDWAEVSRLAKSPHTVHPEPVEGSEPFTPIRVEPFNSSVRPEPVVREAHHERRLSFVCPEPVVRQVHHERWLSFVRPEPVEGPNSEQNGHVDKLDASVHGSTLRQAQDSPRTEKALL